MFEKRYCLLEKIPNIFPLILKLNMSHAKILYEVGDPGYFDKDIVNNDIFIAVQNGDRNFFQNIFREIETPIFPSPIVIALLYDKDDMVDFLIKKYQFVGEVLLLQLN